MSLSNSIIYDTTTKPYFLPVRLHQCRFFSLLFIFIFVYRPFSYTFCLDSCAGLDFKNNFEISCYWSGEGKISTHNLVSSSSKTVYSSENLQKLKHTSKSPKNSKTSKSSKQRNNTNFLLESSKIFSPFSTLKHKNNEIITCNSSTLVYIYDSDHPPRPPQVQLKQSQHNGRIVDIHPFFDRNIIYSTDSYGRINCFGKKGVFHDIPLGSSKLYKDLTTDDWSD